MFSRQPKRVVVATPTSAAAVNTVAALASVAQNTSEQQMVKEKPN
jgi:hypothetical protein